jgi:glycosyltransferase involved in cell wall biosynthesis
MRLAVTTNMMAPYKTPLFETLSRRLDGQFLAIYETEMESNRRWQSPQTLPFKHVVLCSLSIDVRRWYSDTYLHVPLNPLSALTRFQPDVVVLGGGAWTSPLNLIITARSRHLGCRLVPWWGSFGHRRKRLRKTLDPVARRFVRSGDAWIAGGSRARSELIEYGAEATRVTIARELPGDPIAHDLLPQRQARGGRTPRYLFVGQLIQRKGVGLLLQAFEQLPRGELWIAGAGELLDLVEAAARSDPRIRYFGHQSTEALKELYRHSDVLVLPSLYEVWGIVVNEALLHGLPVIATTQVGAAADLLEEGVNGLIINPGDVTALRAAMTTVASWAPQRFDVCAEVNATKIDAWSVDQAAEGILEACSLARSVV